jgi:hypothetical protein
LCAGRRSEHRATAILAERCTAHQGVCNNLA